MPSTTNGQVNNSINDMPRDNTSRRRNGKGESNASTQSPCQCQLIKEFRFEKCGHTELQRGGPQPYCLLSYDSLCAEVGDVRKLLYLVGPGPHSNGDAVGDCFQCHVQRAYLAAHPDATRADLKNETRRALKQSRLMQEHKTCEVLLATGEAKTKPPSRARRGHMIERVERALRFVVSQKYRRVGGPLRHDPEILYRLAAEVSAICQRLGPDADRLMLTFGQLVTAYHQHWASHLYKYVRAYDVRLGSVYIEAFTEQQQKNEVLRKDREQKAAQENRDTTMPVVQEEQKPLRKKARRPRSRRHRGHHPRGAPESEPAPEVSQEPQAPEGKAVYGSWADECEDLDIYV